MKSREPLVVAIILNWNGVSIKYENKPILELVLKTLASVKYSNLKTIVVDAGSEDDSIKYIRNNFSNVKIVTTKNISYAKSNNAGIKYAARLYKDAKYILLLNSDLIFKDDSWLKKMVDASTLNEKIGTVGCRVRYPDERAQYMRSSMGVFGITTKYTARRSGYVDYIPGMVFLVKMEVLKRVGLFDETYEPFYYEDFDFCEREKRLGYRNYYVYDTNVVHLGSYSIYRADIKRSWSSKEIEYRSIMNSFILLLRWHRFRLIPNYLIYQLAYPFFAIRPEVRVSANGMLWKLTVPISALLNALKRYRYYKIPHL